MLDLLEGFARRWRMPLRVSRIEVGAALGEAARSVLLPFIMVLQFLDVGAGLVHQVLQGLEGGRRHVKYSGPLPLRARLAQAEGDADFTAGAHPAFGRLVLEDGD